MPRAYGARDTGTPTRQGRGSARVSDPRYNQRRWKALAHRIRRRDGRCMIVPGCPRGAQMADHIVPVYPGMPDSLFFAESNLRGGCYYHNTLRGQADKAARELGEGAVFSTEPPALQRPLSATHTPGGTTIDFTRREPPT